MISKKVNENQIIELIPFDLAIFKDKVYSKPPERYYKILLNPLHIIYVRDNEALKNHVDLILNAGVLTVKGTLATLFDYQYETEVRRIHKLKETT